MSNRSIHGIATPKEKYHLPILQALVDLGGAARKADVLERVERDMRKRGLLSDADYGGTRGIGAVRWRVWAGWARNDLKEDGFLRANSPHGVWAIGSAGRRFLRLCRQFVHEDEKDSDEAVVCGC